MEIVDTPKVLKPAEVSIKTLDGSVIEGKVNLGYENRMSDLFTKTDNPFIVVFDAVHLGSFLHFELLFIACLCKRIFPVFILQMPNYLVLQG